MRATCFTRAAWLPIAALAAGAAAADPSEPYSGIPAEMRARAGIAAQAEAWNRGDLEGALDAYCPTADIVWVNKRGVTRGFEEFARSMRADFAGGRAAMGRMDYAIEHAMPLAENKALVTLRWSITRDGKRLMGGISSQLWAHCGHRMRIVFEHAS